MVALKKDKPPVRTTYRDAGVDIRAADDFVKCIGPIADATMVDRPGPIGGIGGFGALFDLKKAGYADPILVSSTDGVGTKLRIAIETKQVDTIGIDLVAMCVNDILAHGAEPLFFLNYFALGRFEKDLALRIVQGIADGCVLAGAALVGGETAEMPGFYSSGDFDLAGFAVGAVERGKELPRRRDIQKGDALVGISSSGVHSNGYSLVRELVKNSGLGWSDMAPFDPNKTLGEALLEPTRIYVKSVLQVLKKTDGIKALAHITGSGALGKLHRILPSPSAQGVRAHIELGTWQVPAVFRWLRDQANYSNSKEDEEELLRAFNCGIGMVAVVAKEEASAVLRLLREVGEEAFLIGEIESHSEPSGKWPDFEDAVTLTGSLAFEEFGKRFGAPKVSA
jgi:phosphoribosylformylglycinamidine cyclo-ligase